MANDNSEIQRRIDLLQEHKRWECIKCIVSLIASHQKYRILYMKSYVEAKALVSEMIKGAGLCEMSSENFKKRYQVLPGMKIGEGSYGTVYKGIDLVTHKPVALKILKYSSKAHKDDIR